MSDDKIEQFITEKSGAVMETHPDVPDAFLAMGIDDVRALVALLRAPEARWVPVEERLPEVGEVTPFLVAMRSRLSGLRSYGVEFFCPGEKGAPWKTHFVITHWMPLPELPPTSEGV